MSLLPQIQRGVDYIEARLDMDIDLVAVSRTAGISHSHFQRMFKALTGETLKTYVRARRMANALDALLTTDARILDVAVAAGFESQEAFARAFKKTFGMTPTAYRKVGSRALFLEKVRFDHDYLAHLREGVTMEPEIVERPAMRVVGMRTRFVGPYSTAPGSCSRTTGTPTAPTSRSTTPAGTPRPRTRRWTTPSQSGRASFDLSGLPVRRPASW